MATRRKILHEGVSDLSTFGVFKDENDMASNSGIAVPSQRSVKAYADTKAPETATTIGALIGGAADATPNDTDFVATSLTAGGVLKKITWTNVKAFLKTYFDTLYGTSGTGVGWISLGAATYEGANDPTYTFSFASDMTGILSVGMKIKLTQITGGTKYCFITAVGAYSAGKTIITGYFGTDYDLANEAITAPYYSVQKAPFGFPLDPTKWTVEVTDTTQRSQASPVSSTWYNLGSISISIPIGIWKVSFTGNVNIDSSSAVWSGPGLGLSTSNNSLSDTEFHVYSNATVSSFGSFCYKEKVLNIASKTSYYLIERSQSSAGSTLYLRSDAVTTVIRAICAYL